MTDWRYRICAFAIVLAILPGTGELVENVAHLALEGHFAHAEADGDHHPPSGPEHDCTPTLHLCGCHASLALAGDCALPAIRLRATGFSAGRPFEPPLTGFTPPIDRPPQA